MPLDQLDSLDCDGIGRLPNRQRIQRPTYRDIEVGLLVSNYENDFEIELTYCIQML